MAKITYYLGEISGRMSGLVFSKNKSGAYLKKFSMPSNPSTTNQSKSRAAFQNYCAAWSNLTEPQRVEWRAASVGTYDCFGVLHTLSGRGLFIALNANAKMMGVDPFTDIPGTLVSPTNPTGTFRFSLADETNIVPLRPSAEFNLVLDWTYAGNNYTIVKATPPMPVTCMNPGNNYYFMKSFVTVTPEINFTQEWTDKFGIYDRIAYLDKFKVFISVQQAGEDNAILGAPFLLSSYYGEYTDYTI